MSLSSRPRNHGTMLTDELRKIFGRSIKRAFPELDSEDHLFRVRLEGPGQKYGDYVCMDVVTICHHLRRLDPDHSHQNHRVIARKLLEAVKKEDRESKMLEKLCIHDVGYITFRLSMGWMTERIKKMISDGIDTWAPVLPLKSLVLDCPTPAMDADSHADEIRLHYISEMLYRMLDYSGVVVSPGQTSDESRFAVQSSFEQKGRQIISKRQKACLFNVSRGGGDNKYRDLQTLWYAIYKRREVIVYVTPARRREYIKQCFEAAKNEGWLLGWNPRLVCCGYRTSGVERRKLEDLWNIYNGSDVRLEYLLGLGVAFGYDRESSWECAIKYTYLKTHRLAECAFNVDDMLDQQGNTFWYVLITRNIIFSLFEKGSRGIPKDLKTQQEFLTEHESKERELALHLVQFTEVIREACATLLLHPVCEYIWILCKKFRSYNSEVMERLDKSTFHLKIFLCIATQVVIGKCLYFLGITPESSRGFSRGALMRGSSGFELIPRPRVKARPDGVNPRFEIFSMTLNFSDPTIKNGNVFGIVSLIDTDGLLADDRLPLNGDEHGSVAYFFCEWYEEIRIRNTEVVHFGSPTPCHLVPFSSGLDIYARLVVTTADKCILMCNCSQPIDLRDIWVDRVNLKRGTLQFRGNDGEIDMDYIALKDAVDVSIKLRLEVSDVSDVSDVSYGHITAYYGNTLDQLDEFIGTRYKAIVFEVKSDSPINVGTLSLRKSVMAVPIDGSFVLEARFFDKSDKAILKTKHGFHGMTQGSHVWRMDLQKGTLLMTFDWSQGPKSSYSPKPSSYHPKPSY